MLPQSNIIDVSEDANIKPYSIWLKKLPYTKLEMFLKKKQPFHFPVPFKAHESLFAKLKLKNSLFCKRLKRKKEVLRVRNLFALLIF